MVVRERRGLIDLLPSLFYIRGWDRVWRNPTV